ncbi:hypothetical protein [Actinomadura alba]|uniref:Uncharacterized protein n=1 Tax=Actinomadura alba TaxID=406431 RepID=A0ABR7M215_9ACTN|nr:hypothetical protein [Actinomadura alba]MBC6471158.1 hypothetical protein [Actinomadura alba]
MIRFVQADLVAINPNNPVFQHQQVIQPFLLEGEAEGATVAGGFSCVGWCTYGTQNYPLQTLTRDDVAEGIRNFGTTATAIDAIGYIDTTLNFTFGKSGALSHTRTARGPQVRCDTAVPQFPQTTGCVFRQYRPAMDYSLTGPYPQLAAHIKKAQESGLPGAPGGTPLNRLIDQPMQKKNGDTACPQAASGGYPRPENHDCDEYPFRSTKQGAYTGNPGYPNGPMQPWPARTFDGCEINEPSLTGPDGYSVCMIDSWQNQQGGNALNNTLYVPERVLDGDEFFVEILP